MASKPELEKETILTKNGFYELHELGIEYINKEICNKKKHRTNLKKYTNQFIKLLNLFPTNEQQEVLLKTIKAEYNKDFKKCIHDKFREIKGQQFQFTPQIDYTILELRGLYFKWQETKERIHAPDSKTVQRRYQFLTSQKNCRQNGLLYQLYQFGNQLQTLGARQGNAPLSAFYNTNESNDENKDLSENDFFDEQTETYNDNVLNEIFLFDE